jgi:hypothetical protein
MNGIVALFRFNRLTGRAEGVSPDDGDKHGDVLPDWEAEGGPSQILNKPNPAQLVAAHVEAADPHPQYLTEAEGDARYATGVGAQVEIRGTVATSGDLASVSSPQAGDVYVAQDTGFLWVWNGSSWGSMGPISAGTDLTYNSLTRTVVSSTGTDAVLPEATDSVAGLLPAAEYEKLAGIDAGLALISSEEYLFVEQDENGTITRAVRNDGTQYIPRIITDRIEGGQGEMKTLSQAGSDEAGIVYARLTGGAYQVFRLYEGAAEAQLTTLGDNWSPTLTSESPQRIMFKTNRNGSDEFYVMDLDGSNQVYAVATRDLTIWGDSVASFPISNLTTGFAAAGETPFARGNRNNGSGGTSSVALACAAGVLGWNVTFAGGQINASGDTTVTNMRADLYDDLAQASGWSPNPFSASNWPAKMPQQVIAGVAGRMERLSASSATTTGSGSGGGSVVTVASATGISVGMQVRQTSGLEDHIISGTTVSSISGTAVTLSAPITSTFSNVSLDFFSTSFTYVFRRTTPGSAVLVDGPQYVVPVENTGFGSSGAFPTTSMANLFNSIHVLFLNGPHEATPSEAAVEMEMRCLNAFIGGMTALSKKYIIFSGMASPGIDTYPSAIARGGLMRIQTPMILAHIRRFPNNFIDLTTISLDGSLELGMPTFKEWFSTNHPSVYASDPDWAWNIPGTSQQWVNGTTTGVNAITPSGDGSSGVVTTPYVDTTTNGAGVFCRLGVVASGGVATQVYVAEPGHNYQIGDVLTIPAGSAAGNTAPITATVDSRRAAKLGEVYGANGSIDTSLSYNEWDIRQRAMPRAMFLDYTHPGPYGLDYMCELLARYLQSKGW